MTDGGVLHRTVTVMSSHDQESAPATQEARSELFNPWGPALPLLSGKPRQLADAGSVTDAHGWKVARVHDPHQGLFRGYAFGSYGVSARASCLRRRSGHRAPAVGCDCGFNAMKDRIAAVRLMERWRGFVLLEVDLYGEMVEHRDGWRAGEQDVLRIHVPSRCGRHVCRRATTGLRRRGRRGWHPVCGYHQGHDGVDLSVLRRHGVDVVLAEV